MPAPPKLHELLNQLYEEVDKDEVVQVLALASAEGGQLVQRTIMYGGPRHGEILVMLQSRENATSLIEKTSQHVTMTVIPDTPPD